ncbi:MAG: apolipoprotein N-acyltransferase [Granulosicoccus sp.]
MSGFAQKPVNTPVLSPWLAWIVAICSGLVLPLSFAPTQWWQVAVVSLSILYLLIQTLGVRQAMVIGWLFGLGYFGIGVHWIYHSLHLFGAAIAPLAAALTLVFVLVMTVFPALCCGLWVRLRIVNRPVVNALLFASLWVLLELLRGKLMGGFPWILIGYSQTSGPVGHLAPFIGVYGLSLFIVLMSALVVVILFGNQRSRLFAFPLAAILLLGSFTLKGLEFSTPTGDPLGVRLVQGNIPQAMKFSTERLDGALQLYTSMTTQTPLDDVSLVIWPETAVPTHYDRVEQWMEPFAAAMDARGVDVLTGVFVKEGDDVYNSVQQLGGQRDVYRKRHLVPFGEYMPLRFILDFAARFIDIPMSDLTPGAGPHVPIELQGTSVGVSICYEDVYGELMRGLLPESNVLVNVSNDAWFGNSAAPHQHEQKARMRAREFERPLVRVTNTGVSSAISYKGEILGRIAHDTNGILDVQVQPRDGATLYARTGNWIVFLFTLFVVIIVITASRSTRI